MLTVSGEVHYENGDPAGMIPVRLDTATGAMAASVSTDDSGSFTFRNLPFGSYEVVIAQPGYHPLRVAVAGQNFPVGGLMLTLVPYKPSVSPAQPTGPTISVDQLRVPEKAHQELVRGQKSLEGGKSADAVVHLQKAVTIDPQYAWAFMLLAAAYADQGVFSRADSAIHQALQLDPDNAHGYAYLGYVYDKEGHSAQARQAFERSIHLLDEDWYAHLELARLLLREHEPAAAYPHLLRAHQLHPQLASVHLLLYDDLILLGKKQEALAELDDYLARFPNSPETPKIRQMRVSLAQSLGSQAATPKR